MDAPYVEYIAMARAFGYCGVLAIPLTMAMIGILVSGFKSSTLLRRGVDIYLRKS